MFTTAPSLSTPTGCRQPRRSTIASASLRSLPLITTANCSPGNSSRMRSTRSTWGSQSAPAVTMNVSTNGRWRSSQRLRTSSLRTSQAGTGPADSAQGSTWQTLESASSSTFEVASGAANGRSSSPGCGPRMPSPVLGSAVVRSRTAIPISITIPTTHAYLLPGRGTSGLRSTGSGATRSRSASVSPIALRRRRPASSAPRSANGSSGRSGSRALGRLVRHASGAAAGAPAAGAADPGRAG